MGYTAGKYGKSFSKKYDRTEDEKYFIDRQLWSDIQF
jgi:hypothetical protein